MAGVVWMFSAWVGGWKAGIVGKSAPTRPLQHGSVGVVTPQVSAQDSKWGCSKRPREKLQGTQLQKFYNVTSTAGY